MTEMSEQTLEKIRGAGEIIRRSHKGVFLSGAGISTPSGIPDFRSPQSGLWQHYDPFEVASLLAFRYEPEKFYQWMRPLAETIFNAQPNNAHIAVARLQQFGFIKTVITQNIDGLHQKAGSHNVLEVHGTLNSLTCIRCFYKTKSTTFTESYLRFGTIPHCPSCDGILKPDIILFGEQMPTKIWLKAVEACKECDLMIVAGSSLEVLPVAGLPMRAIENGAHLLIFNHSQTYLDVRADMVFSDDVGSIFPLIVQEIQ